MSSKGNVFVSQIVRYIVIFLIFLFHSEIIVLSKLLQSANISFSFE